MFSVRAMPWHGLGVVLDEYPALNRRGAREGGTRLERHPRRVMVIKRPERTDDFGTTQPAELIPAKRFRPTCARTPLDQRVLRHLWIINEETGKLARAHRERAIEHVLAVFRDRGSAGDTTGNSPESKWVALNAIAEHLGYGRRYTTRTNQVQRSFKDTSLKQRALELLAAA
jgi:hypothetical protein